MSYRDDTIVITDLPRGLTVTITTDYSKTPALSESQTKGPPETVRDVAHRIGETLKHSKPIESVRGVSSRIDEIFNRSKPIDFASEERHTILTKDQHETRVVRQRVQDGDCLPEHLAYQKPFHIYHIDDVAETISKLDGIDQLYEATGESELVSLITTPGLVEFKDLKNKIMKVKGVLNTGV